MNDKKLTSLLVGFLLVASPAFANPIEDMAANLRAAGFQLVLLWLLTLAIVYGILSHLSLPKSISTRGVISIVVAFMVLIAVAGTAAANFISAFTTATIAVAFGIIVLMMLLEIMGAKMGGEHIFAKNPKFWGVALLVLVILIFIGAGGLGIVNLPNIFISLSSPLIAVLMFLVVMVASIWILFKDGKD